MLRRRRWRREAHTTSRHGVEWAGQNPKLAEGVEGMIPR
jgi:hypothetical protein